MNNQDDAVAWVRERFNDPDANAVDARVLGRIRSNPDLAVRLKQMMTQPPEGTWYRLDVNQPNDPALGTPQALEQLNARLRLIGVQAVPFDGEPIRGAAQMWTVHAPKSHVDFVRLLLGGPYAFSYGPDRDAVVNEVQGLSDGQLEALRLCFRDTIQHLRAGQERLQTADIQGMSAGNLEQFALRMPTSFLAGAIAELERVDGIVAREERRRQDTSTK